MPNMIAMLLFTKYGRHNKNEKANKMDKNKFFREATLRICGNLEIEEAMFSTLQFLRQAMPVSRMALEYYDEGLSSMRTIAKANPEGGESVDLITPLSAEAKQEAKKKYQMKKRGVYLFEDPKEEKLAQEMLSFHGIEATSLMVLTLKSGDQMIGTLALIAEGDEKFSQKHVDLISLINEPFAIALSNTLKHRSELKLYDRDFFWEITMRICGNLEIEEGLRACIKYLSQHMPADVLYLERYEENLGSMRGIARASAEKGEKMDALLPLPEQAKAVMQETIQAWQTSMLPPVIVINKPDEEPVTRHLLEALGEPSSSVMSLPLILEGQLAGALVLLAEGNDRFDEHHARLYANLKVPFFVAMSNALKHREILNLKDLLADDNRYLHGELRRLSGDEVIGANFGLKEVMHKVQQVAELDSPVLLLGETGVGKDVIANTIHYSSLRSAGPFVNVNCGAIPDTLLDSELFGHEKGAFTGALSQKRGRFERANKGTIFLDEIGELPLQAQVRLLNVLQSKKIERVGGVKTIPLDIRIIAATNRNLEEMVKLNQFREDLWFRLNVFPIWMPPLRDRMEDIPALLQHFITLKARELKLPTLPMLSPGAIDPLMAYHWPGNVRELENVIERAMILNPTGPLTFEHLNLGKPKKTLELLGQSEETDNLDGIISRHIRRVLSKTKGKVNGPDGAAAFLGINPSTLRNRMKKLGINYGRKSKY